MKCETTSGKPRPPQPAFPLPLRQWLAAVIMLAFSALAIGAAAAWDDTPPAPRQEPAPGRMNISGGKIWVSGRMPEEPALATIHRWTAPSRQPSVEADFDALIELITQTVDTGDRWNEDSPRCVVINGGSVEVTCCCAGLDGG